jgi:hypothetical protein
VIFVCSLSEICPQPTLICVYSIFDIFGKECTD